MGVGTRDQQPIPSAQPTAAPARPDRITLRGAQPLSAIVQRLAADPHPLTRADVAQLQRTIGNAAVSRLLAQRTLLRERAPAGIENPDAAAQRSASPRPAQLRASDASVDHAPATSRKAMSRADGLPEPLKSGIEALSGLAMDDVRIAYGSSAPARIGASAFAQGSHIHLGPGQERHLPHEAWHVAQQKQGRVAETTQLGGAAINDDPALEHEADMMGARAVASAVAGGGEQPPSVVPSSPGIIQGVFWQYRFVLENAGPNQEEARKRYDDYVEKHGYELWWDSEGQCYYKAVLTGGDFTLFRRFGDGLNVWVANKTGLPVGETDEQTMARLTAPAPRSPGSNETASTSNESGEVAESSELDLSDDDEPMFEQIEDRSERPRFIAPLPGRTRQEHEKRPSQLTFHVAVQPDEGKDDIHQRYGAGDLLVAALIMSEDRPDTRYGEDQKSHSVAFSLIRVALQNFAGRSVATLLKFLKQGFAELADESELQENAKEIAQGLIPEGYFDSLAEGRAPLDTWNSLLSGMLYHYETVYHLSQSAVTAKGQAKNRSEQNAKRRLGAAEAALAIDAALKKPLYVDVFGYYAAHFSKETMKKAKVTPLRDAEALLDVDFRVEKNEYVQSLQHWYDLLLIAYPRVMNTIAKTLSERALQKELSKGNRIGGATTVADWVEGFEDPGYELPQQMSGSAEIGDMSATGQAIQIGIRPLFDEDDRTSSGERPLPPERYLLDELSINRINLGDIRFSSQFEKQMSHTTAWTLAREGILGFARQPLANLVFYLIHGFEELAAERDEKLDVKRDAEKEKRRAAERKEAADLAAMLRVYADSAYGLTFWHQLVAQATIEYLRQDQRSASATYSKTAKGDTEGYHIQILRQNELMLLSTGKLWDSREKVIESAGKLLDADLNREDLPWTTFAVAALRWEETLQRAFPNLMRAGGKQILARWHDKPIPVLTSPGWTDLLTLGTPIATVGDLLDHALQTGVAGRGALTALPDAPGATSHSEFGIEPAIGGSDNLFNAFAMSLAGLMGQGVLEVDAVATKLPSVPRAVLEALAGMGGALSPAHRRAIQRILAPALRALVAFLDPKFMPGDPKVAAALAADFGISLAIFVKSTEGVKPLTAIQKPTLEGSGPVPSIGLHVGETGDWSALTTPARNFNLLDASAATPPPLDWISQLPELVEEQLRAQMHRRSAHGRPVEGVFTNANRQYAVWRTSGDNNCSFNGMALVLAGLVAQAQMTVAHLAGALKLPEETVRKAAAAAAEAQANSARGREVEALLAGPLRTAAVSALAASDDQLAQMQEDFLGEVRGLLLLRFTGRRALTGDLFSGAATSDLLKEDVEKIAEAITKDCDGKSNEEKEKLIDAAIKQRSEYLAARFEKSVRPAYLEHMASEGEWAGAPELTALARTVGVHLSIFQDLGGGLFSRDEGRAGAGSALRGTLTDSDIEELRKLDLIWGGAMENPSVYFRRVPEDVVEERLSKNADLLDTFLKLRAGNYFEPKIEIAMFRHRTRAHWSAASTVTGAYNLVDETDRLVGAPITAGTVDSPAFSNLGSAAARAFANSRLGIARTEQEFAFGNAKRKVWVLAVSKHPVAAEGETVEQHG